MLLDMLVEKTRDSISDLDSALVTMLSRLDEISHMATLQERDFVEIGAIVNNFTYLLLYLESNSEHVAVDYVKRHRVALNDAPERNRRLLRLLQNLSCQDMECEASRLAFIVNFSLDNTPQGEATERALAARHDEAKGLFDQLRSDKANLLERLGAHVRGRRPEVAFYGLLSGVESEDTRFKLVHAWEQLDQRHAPGLMSAINGMVGLRRERSMQRGSASVLQETLSRCSIGEDESREFWEEAFQLSIAQHEALEAEIRSSLGGSGCVKANFGRYLNGIRCGRSIPAIPLKPCIDWILTVAKSMFGLTASRVYDVPAHMITFDMFREEQLVGRINFDLWDFGPNRRNANTTIGVRNKTDWQGIIQKPVAHVSCRFRKTSDAVNSITFQNAHSLFHEFGHAINHLLVSRRLPNLSGLEFLPLERLEILSMWFERWVFHAEFTKFLSFSGDDLAGLELSRRIKTLEYCRTHLERALICALDFEVHKVSSDSIEDSYRRIDRRFGVSRYCGLADVLEYFTWPMLISNPGAYFAYLWGAGASASRFEPLMSKELAGMPGPAQTFDLFKDCFSFDAQSIRPEPRDIFNFYSGPVLAYRPGA